MLERHRSEFLQSQDFVNFLKGSAYRALPLGELRDGKTVSFRNLGHLRKTKTVNTSICLFGYRNLKARSEVKAAKVMIAAAKVMIAD